MMRSALSHALAVLAGIHAAAPAYAQEQEVRPCAQVDSVRVCGSGADATRVSALAERLGGLLSARANPVVVTLEEWTERAVVVRVVVENSEQVVRVPVGDLPLEPTGLEVRVRTVAMVVLDHLEHPQASPAWIDERPPATEHERSAYYGLFQRPLQLPQPGLSSITTRARGLAMTDRVGASLSAEFAIEHFVDDVFTLGLEVAPAWIALGDRLTAGIAGGMATAHVVLDGDVIAFGLYGGIAAMPRPGTPLGALFGIRIRIGLLDFAHGEIRGSLAYSDALGVVFGDLRAEILFPATESIEVIGLRADVAPEFGWAGLEAGARFWTSGRRDAGESAIEVMLGARMHGFLQRCEFGGCAMEWGAGGPTLSVAWVTRLR